MRTRLLILLACASCDPALVTQLDLVRASDLAGTYTGVLQGVSVRPSMNWVIRSGR
jgi:hypothetical protein